MLQSAGVDRNKINIKRERERGEKKASRWIMNYWHRLYFMWLLNRSTNVASRMTTWLQYALWPPQKDWSVFLNVQNSIRSRFLWRIIYMHSVFRARFWAAAEIGLMFGGERCIWMAEVKFPNVPCKIILNKFKFNIKLPLYLNWEIPLKPLHKWKIPPPSSPCLFLYAAASSVVLLSQ